MRIKFQSSNKIVALVGKKVVGYLQFEYSNDYSKRRNIDISYIHINKNYRRKGIGTLLLIFLYVKKPEVTWVSLWTSYEMEKNNAHSFYAINGYTEMAYQEDYYENGVGTRLYTIRIKRKRD